MHFFHALIKTVYILFSVVKTPLFIRIYLFCFCSACDLVCRNFMNNYLLCIQPSGSDKNSFLENVFNLKEYFSHEFVIFISL